MSGRRLPTAVVVLLAAVGHVVALQAPAQADPDRLKLSWDGVTYTESLTGPLFEGAYAPGTVDRTFYVKNESPSTTRFTVSLANPATSSMGDLVFSAAVGDFQGAPVQLSGGGKKRDCRTLVTSGNLAPRATTPVKVYMTLPQDMPMNQQASFAFVATLSQVTNKGKADVCGAQPPGGQSVQVMGAQSTSAKTVTPAIKPASSDAVRSSTLIAGLAAGTLTAGALLLVGSRRRRRTS